jgi:hypothetical protein
VTDCDAKYVAAADRLPGATVPSRARDAVPSNIESNISYHDGGNEPLTGEIEVETEALIRARRRLDRRFLKGPIPLRQIATAARLPGQALALLLAVHHQTALTRKAVVTLPKGLLSYLGVSRDAKARSLRALEVAGLLQVERRVGRSARVSIVAS